MVGLMLGHYRLITKIGEGGMGVVYRAHDEHLHRDVALKVLPPGKLRDESTRRQFRKEALTLSKLNHPNVATVYDFDTQDGTDFLVLEYIPGITLSTKLTAGPLREVEIAHLGAQLAEGLEAAHRHGVIHRDLKPSNLRMDPDGRLKILDFGLARMLSPLPDAPTESLTETQAGAGTLPYMAPEQLRGSPADHRTDIYSSGVVLYEMATGRRPFDGKMPTLVSDAILHQPPAPPTTLNRRLSASLESIILKAIDKRPEHRYQSAKELQIDLKRLDDPTARLIDAQKRGVARQRVWTVVLAMVLLLAAVFAAVPSVRRAVQQWITPAGNTPRVLAVLPFETIGADDQQAFSRGLSEALTAALGKLNQKYLLEVVPASEVRAQAVTNREQARQILGVDLVLEGSLHFAQQARITYSLVDVRSRQQLDSGLLTVETADVFAMEDQVIDKVLAAMQIQLQSDEKSRLVARGTAQSAAYQYYLRGQGYLLACDQEPNAELAIPVFQRALQEDPNFPLAYAGLSEAYWCRYEQTKQGEWVGRATETCQRALALGAGLAPVHVACGRVSLGTGKYEDAISSYERALQIEPASDAGYRGLATSYEALGRLEDAERAYQRAITLRPDYWGVYRRAGVFYFNHGRYDDADRMFRRVIELAPENARGYSNLGGVAFAQGKWAEARRLYERSNEIQPNYRAYSNLGTLYFLYESRYADAARAFEKALELANHDARVWHNLAAAYYWAPSEREKAKAIYQRTAHMVEQELRVNPRDPDLLIRRADCLAMLGDSAQARKLIERALRLAPDNLDILFQAGDIYESIGDRARAIEEIGKALKKGYSPEAIKRAPGLDGLRSDPRFLKLFEGTSKGP